MSELFAGLKVMVIDDAQTITRAAEIYLNGKKTDPTGLIVKTASEGYDGIPEILRNFKPDIIFLDVVMGKVGGLTMCKAIKGNPNTSHIVVIMLTSKEGIFDRARALDVGADDYVTKPFTKEEILKRVEIHAAKIKAAK